MTACDWCEREFPEKPNKRFCCPQHKDAFHAACRAYTRDMLRQRFVTRETLRARYGPCTAGEALDMRGMIDGNG